MLIALLAIVSTGAMAQNSFNYQAVIRDGGKIVENKTVNLRLSVMLDDKVYYSEQHAATTNAYGNVSVSVGEGTPLTGKFEDIPWQSMRVMLQVEVSTDGSDKYTNMGSMQIQPVPYAFYAARASVIQPAVASDEPIFQVKDNAGNLLFAVYETGVKVFVDDNKNDDAKAAKSKFAVAGRSAKKGEETLLTINSDGTTVFVDDNDNKNDNYNSKAAKSRFAVSGRSAKNGEGDLLSVDGEGSTIYVSGEGKAAKSKFAVAGRSAKKAAENNYSLDNDGSTVYVDFNDNASKADTRVLSIDGTSATFYVDDIDEGKAAKSKFAVAGRSANKSVDTAFIIDGSGTLIYIDDLEGDKAAKSKFAVAGRSANKGNDKFFTIDRDSTRIYINDAPVAADTTGAEPGSTPLITPSFASAFAIVGLSQKTELLTVNKDSTTIKVDTYVAEEVQSNSGEVEKIVDDSKASKVYTTGIFMITCTKENGFERYDEVYYTYYRNGADEYLYLLEHFSDAIREFRNYWIVDGKIYRDTAYLQNTANWNVEPIYTYKNKFGSYFDECDWQEYWDAEPYTTNGSSNGGLLTILESKIRKDGYKVRNEEGINYYYEIVENEEMPVAQTERNTVTAIFDTVIFNNNLATFKMLLEPSVAIIGRGFDMDSVTSIEWMGEGYTLFDDEVITDSIVAKENEIGIYYQGESVTANNESDVIKYKYEYRKHTLDEIEYMFRALKNGFVVMVTQTDGGTVSGIDVGHGSYNYFDQITLTANANEGYIFTGWSDGNTENPRTIAVTKHLNLWANFANISELYELVDLGLATKWATANLGAKSANGLGNYYAWGEVQPKETYTAETYTLNHASNFQDAATSMLGGGYRIPSQSDWRVLMDSCKWEFDDNYNATVTGPNGNSIYLPANCGFYDDEGYQSTNSRAYYWSRTLSKEGELSSAWTAWFGYDSETPDGYGKGFDNSSCTVGYQIRPVANTFYVATGKNSNGGGKVTGGGVYKAGQSVALTAVPDPYCSFVAWGDGVTDNPRTVTPTDNITMYANFTPPSTLFVSGEEVEGERDGSENAPFASISDAITKINTNRYEMEYTIKIKSNLTGTQTIDGENIMASKITLQGAGVLAEYDTTTINANSNNTVLKINTTVPVEISNLKLTGGKGKQDMSFYYGGGIYIMKGTVTLAEGAIISGNGDNDCIGGGVYVSDGARLNMTGGIISGNLASNGGGVYVSGVFNMTGGVIAKNTGGYGGGVYVGGKMYMSGTAVIGDKDAKSPATETDYSNKAWILNTACGGGIYTYWTSELYIGYKAPETEGDNPVSDPDFTGGIYHNYAHVDGGGVLNYGGKVYICNGEISNNKADSNGSGICVSIPLGHTSEETHMSGGAEVASNNDVYLESNTKITIDGSLNKDNVATITLPTSSYINGTLVLDGNYSQNENKFEVTPYNGTWTIYNGCLDKQQ